MHLDGWDIKKQVCKVNVKLTTKYSLCVCPFDSLISNLSVNMLWRTFKVEQGELRRTQTVDFTSECVATMLLYWTSRWINNKEFNSKVTCWLLFRVYNFESRPAVIICYDMMEVWDRVAGAGVTYKLVFGLTGAPLGPREQLLAVTSLKPR